VDHVLFERRDARDIDDIELPAALAGLVETQAQLLGGRGVFERAAEIGVRERAAQPRAISRVGFAESPPMM
jgi:hypothetical protein